MPKTDRTKSGGVIVIQAATKNKVSHIITSLNLNFVKQLEITICDLKFVKIMD